jgi:hypothetical protein
MNFLADESVDRQIWTYYQNKGNFMYYLAFLNGKLQRIVGIPCSLDDADCFDLK